MIEAAVRCSNGFDFSAQLKELPLDVTLLGTAGSVDRLVVERLGESRTESLDFRRQIVDERMTFVRDVLLVVLQEGCASTS